MGRGASAKYSIVPSRETSGYEVAFVLMTLQAVTAGSSDPSRLAQWFLVGGVGYAE